MHEVAQLELNRLGQAQGSDIGVRMIFDVSKSLDRRRLACSTRYLFIWSVCIRYNVATANEVAAIIQMGGHGEIGTCRTNFAVHHRTCNVLHTISHLAPECEPMSYPLFFPHGQRGWSQYMRGLKRNIFKLKYNKIMHQGRTAKKYLKWNTTHPKFSTDLQCLTKYWEVESSFNSI